MSTSEGATMNAPGDVNDSEPDVVLTNTGTAPLEETLAEDGLEPALVLPTE